MKKKNHHTMDEKAASVYVQTAQPEEENFKDPLFNMVTDFIMLNTGHSGPKILDVGCGPGQLVRRLGKSIPHGRIIGADISQTMIRGAAAAALEAGIDNADFIIADAHNLPFIDEYFDIVLSTGSLCCWNDPLQSISEMYRCLKKNGFFYLNDLRKDSPQAAIDHIAGLLDHPGRKRGFLSAVADALTMHEFKSLFARSGIPHYVILEDFPEQIRKKHIPNYAGNNMIPSSGMHVYAIKQDVENGR